MNVRLGINPLTWSNDDLPSLGAEIKLETCLREARAAGFAGVELGHKFPRDAAVLGPSSRAHGLALVSGWYSARLLERDVDAEFAAMQPHLELLLALGCEVMVVAEVTGCVHGDRARASFAAAADAARPLAGVRRAAHRARRAHARPWHAPRLSPSHGHRRAVRGGHRHADGRHRAGGRAAARHRPPGVCRRRPGRVRATLRRAHRARALQGRAGRTCWPRRAIATRVSSMPCSRASSPCPATAASITAPCSRRLRRPATGAGWSSKPSRTRQSPTR